MRSPWSRSPTRITSWMRLKHRIRNLLRLRVSLSFAALVWGLIIVSGFAILRASAVETAARPPQAPQQTVPSDGFSYRNCAAARAAGAAPLSRGQRGYGAHLDRDGDGIACEPYAQ
jgi:uncharacterized SAM-binding protein YcdF (DUF218 family)